MVLYDSSTLYIPTGLGVPVVNEDLLLQSKDVYIEENGPKEIYADKPYKGLSRVSIYTEVPSVINNQEKTIEITQNNSQTIVVPDASYSGLDRVIINTDVETHEVLVQDSKTIAIRNNGTYTVNPDYGYDALGSVQVDASINFNLESLEVDPTTSDEMYYPSAGYDGIGSVLVHAIELDSSTLYINRNGNYSVTSNVDGLSRVDVSVNVATDASAYYDEGYTDGYSQGYGEGYTEGESTGTAAGIAEQKAKLTSLVVNANGTYTREDGYNDVSVNIDTSSYYDDGYSAGETAGITEGIAQQKAKLDSSTFTTNGTFTREDGWNEITVDIDTINNQNKTIDSSTASQTVTPDLGYTGLGQVVINPYVLDSKQLNVNANGTFVIESSANGLSRVDVSVNIDTSSYYDDGYSAGEAAGYAQGEADGIAEGIAQQKALLDSSTFTTNGTFTSENGWNEITVQIDGINNQNKTIDSSTASQIVTPDTGYTGLSQVTINAVTSSIDANIQAGNIKQGVEILGVQGTFQGGTLQSKTVNSSTTSQVITPDSGNYGLSSVTVNPYTLDSKTVDASIKDQIVTSSADGLSSVKVNKAKLAALPVQLNTLDLTTNINVAGTAITRTPPTGYIGWNTLKTNKIYNQRMTVDASINDVVYTREEYFQQAPYNMSASDASNYTRIADVKVNAVTAAIDPNIVSSNIKFGVEILGIQGTYSGGSLQAKTVDSSTAQQIITPDSGNYGLSSVTINAYDIDSCYLLAANI